MDQVFAPWRIEWVEREDKNEEFSDCVFCELLDRSDDREHLLLARGDHAYVLLNNYPYNPGHVMVIPHQHTGDYTALDDASLRSKERLIQRAMTAMNDAFAPDGYNVGYNLGGSAAGGSIDDHLHAHVVPRWHGDTNFMATISETKVIVEAVRETYDRLHEAFRSQTNVDWTDEDGAVIVAE